MQHAATDRRSLAESETKSHSNVTASKVFSGVELTPPRTELEFLREYRLVSAAITADLTLTHRQRQISHLLHDAMVDGQIEIAIP
jgi:hypothetical protein